LRRYHKRVQQGIKLFGEREDNREQFLNVNVGSRIIYIHDPTNRRLAPLEYKPDATIISRSRRKIVFQVLDAQARKNREIEADMIRGFLSPDVSIMVFITASRSYAEKVERISTILSENLHSYGVRDHSMPITISLVIPRTVRTAERTMRYFNSVRGELIKSA